MKTSYLMPRLKKNSILAILFLIFSTSLNLKAQDCATPNIPIEEMQKLPWFGNVDYLPSFMDSLQNVYSSPNARVETGIIWRIPIRFWTLTEGNINPLDLLDDGEVTTGGNPNPLPQEEDLQRLIDDANFAFSNADAPTNIRFYMAGNDLVDDVNNSDMSDTNLFLHLRTHSEWVDEQAINIYIRSGDDKGQYFNPALGGYIVLQRRTYRDSGRAATMAHELGHYLGLAHTHQWVQTPCLREPVVRGNSIDAACGLIVNYDPFNPRCSYTGDALCDTEADPNMSWIRSDYDEINCIHRGTVTDYRGDTYRPLPNNYMAYGNRRFINNDISQTICRTQFTRDQVGVMQFTLQNSLRGRFGIWKVDAAGRSFDTYEPNNTINGAENIRGELNPATAIVSFGRRGITNILEFNQPQVHSFHKSLDGQVRDNFDWIPIEVPPNGVLENYIITAESTIPNLIEDIEVFTAGVTNGVSVEVPLLARLVSDTQPNQTRWTISIPCGIVNNPNRLFLRVRRNQNLNEFGTYTVLGTSDAPEISVIGNPVTICTDIIYTAELEDLTLTPD